jgi:hypothetical protein
MIDRDHALPLAHQAQLLELSRGSLYYMPVPISQADLALMSLIGRLHTDYPFAGARMLRDMLRLRGHRVGRRHVGRLMRLMGIEALYRKRRGTKTNPAHPVYPYLLRNIETFSGTSRSTRRIRCGARTSRTSRCVRAFFISLPFWIGSRAKFWRGDFRTA